MLPDRARRCGWSPTWSSGASTEMPRWHPISISGYHIREAGSTAQQELAFTLKDGFTYVERALERGLDVDDFAPRLSLLLQRPHRLLRGDRQVPRRPPDLGARDARHLRRPRRALADDALPHPDGGRLADRPAAAGEHRPDDDRGARRRARRDPVAAHQLLRRGARAADRGGGPGRAAHPAGDRPRVRASPTRPTRSAAPTSSRSSPTRWRRPPTSTSRRIDELGGMVEAIKTGFPQREIADAAFRYQREVDSGERIVVGVNALPARRRADARAPPPRPGGRAAPGGPARPPPARRATSAAVDAALAELAPRPPDGREPDAAFHRRGARARLGGRDGRRAPGGLRAPTPSTRSSDSERPRRRVSPYAWR